MVNNPIFRYRCIGWESFLISMTDIARTTPNREKIKVKRKEKTMFSDTPNSCVAGAIIAVITIA
jgi:hypothetical protein